MRTYLCVATVSSHLLAFASEEAFREYLADVAAGEAEEILEHTIHWTKDKKLLAFLKDEGQFYE